METTATWTEVGKKPSKLRSSVDLPIRRRPYRIKPGQPALKVS
ncbi:MAG: hypothetical protein V9H25_09615 [Candidatus Competibacter sp.]